MTLKDHLQWGTHCAFRNLPIPVASGIGGAIGSLVMGRHIRADRLWIRRFRENYRKLFGEGASADADRCLMRLGGNIGRGYAEYAVNEKYQKSDHLRYEGLEHFKNLPSSPILLTAHLGNFELAASCLAYNGTPVTTISDLNLDTVDQRIAIESRRRCFAHAPGSHMIKVGASTMRHVVDEMKSGAVIVIYCDEYKDGLVWGPALGRTVPMRGNRVLAAKLALKFKAPILPAFVRREKGCRLVSIVEPPLYLPGRDHLTMEELAHRIDAKVEAWVREGFDQWYWAPKLAMDRKFS